MAPRGDDLTAPKRRPGTAQQRRWRKAYRRCCECPLCWPRKWATRSRQDINRAAINEGLHELYGPHDDGCYAFCGPCMCGDYYCYDAMIDHFYKRQDAQADTEAQ